MMAHHHHLLDFSFSSSSPLAPFHHADTTPWPPPTHATVVGHERGLPYYYTAPPTTMPAMTQPALLLNSSRYMGPARELLAELCSLTDHAARTPKAGGGQWDVEANYSASWDNNSNPGALLSYSSMDLLALQRRKARLLSMVQEVDRRYRRYREQMRATELSFDAVAGTGAAQVYTKLAMRAMSRHFRSLRDALVRQVRALRKTMGEGDTTGGLFAAPGASRGDTPRLRVLDQCLRQQRAFQQSGGTTESYPWRPQRGLPERAVAVLRSWLFEHFLHPKKNKTGIQMTWTSTSWRAKPGCQEARVRLWKPMIEEMYTEEETKEQGGGNGGGKTIPDDHHGNTGAAWAATRPITGEIPPHRLGGSSCFVSAAPIIPANDGQQLFHSYLSSNGGAVSLTLGLQQRQQQPAMMIMQQRSSSLMLGAGDQEEEEDVVLPYRNLMGSELLHDLADPIVYN
ncbi:homeobox protein BEL1 homolog isoform X2 [Brachypodium distachyon]|uniref:homeobox protein BEL1 homolog isoform X2 n=1 Tax=Brachypodium distachyon TaxID=15368 RepID=UPI000D0CD6FD|nr:homeobox protein BEL1 homolog isoform X2 [Brachypodium distachyon]|eukprot:XP_024313068.1 homeobox protein BEL1 homolog isoform X2 [Brachypodium distachyon]